jgi:hypothetical protein
MKLWRLPKIAISMWGWSVSLALSLSLSLSLTHTHTHTWVKGKNFGQRIWDKVNWYWEHPWEIHWEPKQHHWEYDRNTRILKIHPHTPPPFPKGKKMNSIGCMFSPLLGCIHILFLDMVAIHLYFTLAKTYTKHTVPIQLGIVWRKRRGNGGRT